MDILYIHTHTHTHKQFVHTLTHILCVGVRSKENEGTGIHFICLFSVFFRNFRLHLNTLFLVTDIVKDVPTHTQKQTKQTHFQVLF